MRFITEDDLRRQYQKQPFECYVPMKGTRLTPGARQFLNDRRISIEAGTKKTPTAAQQPAENLSAEPCDGALWKLRLKTLQAEFLQCGTELLESDLLTAEEIFKLERCLSEIPQETHDSNAWKNLCPSCEHIGPENCGQCMEDCFEVNGFHAQSPAGKSIVKLHLLRCRLREFAQQLPEEKREMAYMVMNRLSQLICHLFGGKRCQQK